MTIGELGLNFSSIGYIAANLISIFINNYSWLDELAACVCCRKLEIIFAGLISEINISI